MPLVPQELQTLVGHRIASRISGGDTTAFTDSNAPATLSDAIRNRLGWLAVPTAMQARLAELRTVVEGIRGDGIRHAYLLGMGGSSLCAEVFRRVVLPGPRALSLAVLDTTDERTISGVTSALDPGTSLFIVASKSGTTLEVSSLEQHFRAAVTPTLGARTGAHFIAITDPGTPLVAHAAAHEYRHTFVNPPDIGGRYSALSLFGLVPAALLDVDLDALLRSAGAMAARCAADAANNPGLALGAFMATHARAGRDKLTILLPTPLRALGLWIEQLIAESTGKQGRGILPVAGEPVGAPGDYGTDRAFVVAGGEGANDLAADAADLDGAGHPVWEMTASAAELGAAFFQWEFATAVAGTQLGINPFDEPNVAEAKKRTQALLDAHRDAGTFPMAPPLTAREGRLLRTNPADAPLSLDAAPGHYVAILDYLPPDDGREAAVAAIRRRIMERHRFATTHGYGPRYLHSTGQYHKGGPNTGIFVLLTAADATSTPIPGADYSFSVLKQAQALGDFATLSAAGRRVIHIHIDDAGADFSTQMTQVFDTLI